MSGWMKGRPSYQLTASKCRHWHRHRFPCPEGCESYEDVLRAHLEPAGFREVGPYGELEGPGLAEGRTDELYQAVSGEIGPAQGASFTRRPAD